jgi:hypothetical protein
MRIYADSGRFGFGISILAAVVAALRPSLLPLTAPALLVSAMAAAGFAMVSVYWRSSSNDRRFAVGVTVACITSTVAGALTLLATMKLVDS